MPVDSFKYLPRLIEMFYKMTEVGSFTGIPWTPLQKPVSESKFGLVTSAGLYNQANDEPFDLERERREPTWGDPTAREIDRTVTKEDIAVSHLHINTDPIIQDVNIVLPLDRMDELAHSDEIGGLADIHFSVMGFQGFPPDTSIWQNQTGPRIAEYFRSVQVDCVLLTPA